MSNQEEWNEFLENIFNNALNEYQNTNEYTFLKEKREQLEERLTEKFLEDKQKFLDNCSFEIYLDAERKMQFLYQQGFKDCVEILKNLGVLA